MAAGEVELGFTVSLASLPSRVSVTAPLGLPEVAGDPLNVGIVWDAENHLVEVRQGAATLASFVYDGQGRRQQKVASGVTHTYVSDLRSRIEERVSTGQTLRYVEGPGIDQHLAMQDSAAVTYYVADHLRSVVQETNAAGAATLAREFDPWGNLLSGAGAAGWAFTGREWDPEIQLYYYRARFYDPELGRFISPDPLGRGSDDANLYRYVGNNALARVDPLGLSAVPMPMPMPVPAPWPLPPHAYIVIGCIVLVLWVVYEASKMGTCYCFDETDMWFRGPAGCKTDYECTQKCRARNDLYVRGECRK